MKPRYSQGSECKGKCTYATKKEAKRATKRARRFVTRAKSAYRCSWCGRFHMGGKPKWNDQCA